jgi:DNA-binding transcriptional regulator YhcF (GntR family)
MEIIKTAPQSVQVADYLRGNINSGKFPPGKCLAPIRKLAENFSVGRQVIVSALSILEDEQLIESRRGCGTFVKVKNKKSRHKVFGLFSTYTRGNIEGYFESMTRTFSEYNCLCIPVEGNSIDNLKMLIEQNIDVLLVDVHFSEYPEIMNELKSISKYLPVCYVHRYDCVTSEYLPAVIPDIQNSLYETFKYLFDKGNDTIIILTHNKELVPVSRLSLEKTAERFGKNLYSDSFKFISWKELNKNPELMDKLFDNPKKKYGVKGAADSLCFDFLRLFSARFPDTEIDIVGSYNDSWSRIPGMEFPSVDLNFREMWKTVIEKFIEEDIPEREFTLIQPKLIEREKS